MEPIVGIDLGTTNSEIAFIINENAEVIRENDNGIVPSCVGLNGDGQVIVGRQALNQAVVAPEKTVLSVKRRMGSEEKIPLGNETYSPREISAFILKALKERAERSLGKPIGKAVITVPAYFTDAQRQATREAGQIAGLEVVRIINEPTAAALAYESTLKDTQKILVYDLGGGTFDVSIVKIEDGIVEVLASTGDNRLGGDDFDQKIVDRLVEYIENELKVSKVRENKMLMARLKQAAEKAKIELSDVPFTIIEEDHIGKRFLKDVHLSYEFSRADFENMIQDELARTMDSVSKALQDASLAPADMDQVILVGGSTRIPAIPEMLVKKIGKQPHGEIDPDLCVALGAAIQAGREMGIDSTSILLDITPYTFGTAAMADYAGSARPDVFVPLIRRNTKLPASHSEVFYTVFDRQKAAEIKVYQGEKPIALDNFLIGKYMFNLSQLPQGSEIVLKMDLDLNGILKIHCVEKKTGNNIDAVIENVLRQPTDEEMAASRERIDSMWNDDNDGDYYVVDDDMESGGEIIDVESREVVTEFDEILQKAQKGLDAAPSEDRDEIVNLMEDLRDAIRENDTGKAREAAEELGEILYYIG